MVALKTMVLVCAWGAAGDTVLLDFSAKWCGPCRQMEPTIRRLASEGYAVRQVDIDQHRQLAAQYGVTQVPCFVLVSGGREVARSVGAQSYGELVQMFARAEQQLSPPTSRPSQPDMMAAPPAEVFRGQSPDRPGGRLRERMAEMFSGSRGGAADAYPPPPAGAASPPLAMSEGGIPNLPKQQQDFAIDDGPRRDPSARFEQAPGQAGPENASQRSSQQRALRASVRLTVESPSGNDIGSGTIIDVHGREALVVTCGHIFRESAGKGPITVEFCGLPGAAAVPGEVISYDASRRDIALVAIRPQVPVEAVGVAPEGFRIAERQPVFSVGCDNGGPARVIDSHVSGIDRYVGPPNIEVSGQPTQGRSGGGLFSAEGLLIGICNAADPADDEGIYAALSTVHEQLAQAGLRQLFASADRPRAAVPSPPRFSGRTAPFASAGDRNGGTESSGDAGMEIILIMRPQDGQTGRSEALTIRNPSRELLDMMRRESSQATAGASGAGEFGGRIVRGQSGS